MNFEGFVDLLHRVVEEWYSMAKREVEDIEAINAYLENSPFSAKQTPENERAYEKLMDLRMKMFVSEGSVMFGWKNNVQFQILL